MGRKKKIEQTVDNLQDNKSMVSIRLRTIADEYDSLLFVNDALIRENNILKNEVRVLLKELDLEDTDGIRKLIRAKALLMR